MCHQSSIRFEKAEPNHEKLIDSFHFGLIYIKFTVIKMQL